LDVEDGKTPIVPGGEGVDEVEEVITTDPKIEDGTIIGDDVTGFEFEDVTDIPDHPGDIGAIVPFSSTKKPDPAGLQLAKYLGNLGIIPSSDVKNITPALFKCILDLLRVNDPENYEKLMQSVLKISDEGTISTAEYFLPDEEPTPLDIGDDLMQLNVAGTALPQANDFNFIDGLGLNDQQKKIIITLAANQGKTNISTLEKFLLLASVKPPNTGSSALTTTVSMPTEDELQVWYDAIIDIVNQHHETLGDAGTQPKPNLLHETLFLKGAMEELSKLAATLESEQLHSALLLETGKEHLTILHSEDKDVDTGASVEDKPVEIKEPSVDAEPNKTSDVPVKLGVKNGYYLSRFTKYQELFTDDVNTLLADFNSGKYALDPVTRGILDQTLTILDKTEINKGSKENVATRKGVNSQLAHLVIHNKSETGKDDPLRRIKNTLVKIMFNADKNIKTADYPGLGLDKARELHIVRVRLKANSSNLDSEGQKILKGIDDALGRYKTKAKGGSSNTIKSEKGLLSSKIEILLKQMETYEIPSK